MAALVCGRRRLSCGASPDAVEAKMPKWEQTRRDVENESCERFTAEVIVGGVVLSGGFEVGSPAM